MEETNIKYEYQEDRVTIKSGHPEDFIKYLNKRGAEGWELISYEKLHIEYTKDLYISLFKRQIR